jgi:hypothetical protein
MFLEDVTGPDLPSPTDFSNGSCDILNDTAPMTGFLSRRDHERSQRLQVTSEKRPNPFFQIAGCGNWFGRCQESLNFTERNSAMAAVCARRSQQPSAYPALYRGRRYAKSTSRFASTQEHLVHILDLNQGG